MLGRNSSIFDVRPLNEKDVTLEKLTMDVASLAAGLIIPPALIHPAKFPRFLA